MSSLTDNISLTRRYSIRNPNDLHVQAIKERCSHVVHNFGSRASVPCALQVSICGFRVHEAEFVDVVSEGLAYLGEVVCDGMLRVLEVEFQGVRVGVEVHSAAGEGVYDVVLLEAHVFLSEEGVDAHEVVWAALCEVRA